VKKITKWGVGLVMTLAMIFMASQASAVVLGKYYTGQLVPRVVHDGACVDTVVGLNCSNRDAAAGCDVYWTFFDVDSTHITDGWFHMTDNEYRGFSWRAESGFGLEDVEGYLVFTAGTPPTAPPCLSADMIFANSFMVDLTGKDAVFVPVLPLIAGDYAACGSLAMPDLEHMTATSIITATAASAPGTILDIRYWMDPAYNAETKVVLWSVCDISGTYTVNMFNDAEDRKSLNFDLENEELNLMDPATILGRPVDFIDGFIRYTVPNFPACPTCKCVGNEVNWMFVYSYVDSDLVGAMQTLLAGDLNSVRPWSPDPGPCE
jgi:hypothetical protein